MLHQKGLEGIVSYDDARDAGRRERRFDALIRWDERDNRGSYPFDQAQVMAGKILVEQGHGGGEGQNPALTELGKLERRQAGQRECFRQLELTFIRFKGILIKLVDVLQEPRRSR